MLTISDKDVFGKVVADALVSVSENAGADTPEAKRCLNAIAKAAAR
jgi:hypothetical protein